MFYLLFLIFSLLSLSPSASVAEWWVSYPPAVSCTGSHYPRPCLTWVQLTSVTSLIVGIPWISILSLKTIIENLKFILLLFFFFFLFFFFYLWSKRSFSDKKLWSEKSKIPRDQSKWRVLHTVPCVMILGWAIIVLFYHFSWSISCDKIFVL